jgi:hypothetical protein
VRVNNLSQRNIVHDRIVNKHGQQRRVELETDDETLALATEIRLIIEHRTYAHGGEGWWGANLTLGGDGTSGRKWTEEQRKAASKRRKGTRMPQSFVQRHSEVMKERWKDPAYRQKIMASRNENPYKVAPELKAKLSSKATERWADPAFVARLSKPRKCKTCGESGHMARTCARPEKRRGPLSAYRARIGPKKSRTCKTCGAEGHYAKTCTSAIDHTCAVTPALPETSTPQGATRRRPATSTVPAVAFPRP